MTAEVSSVVRIMNESSSGNKSTALMTRDLLGECRSLDSKELDLDLQVPSGWEKRLDLMSGKVYLQRCNSSSTNLEQKQQNYQTVGKLQDLNFPPSSKQPLNLFDEPNLDLKLLPSSSSSSSYHSVCTLEKVKSALERAEKETTRKRSISVSMSSSPRSNSSSSIKDTDIDQENLCSSIAAGCPGCLLYVLISKNDPKCPRCHTIVPLPVAMKKPRIDLNISI
ncbi:protein CURLY FLAG LEAF 2-like [Lycium ferocissimum]|uniref:protein CURLY FLAG LEAF 2-like n=1 Tax=Lycium ferocissimum TaxID=112874 RepID=UPI002814AEA4|nr:protein CURLY FLAG LEAF 2-like [Lycium ferocissimum]